MKKKLSVSLILVLVLTLTVLGLAYALVQSRIAGELYGDTAAPSDVMDRIQTPDPGIGQTAADLASIRQMCAL